MKYEVADREEESPLGGICVMRPEESRNKGTVDEQSDLAMTLPAGSSAPRHHRAPNQMHVHIRFSVVPKGFEGWIDDVQPGGTTAGNTSDSQRGVKRDCSERLIGKATQVA